MNKPPEQPDWPAALGSLLVLGVWTSLALIAVGGWQWFRSTLDTSAPAWIQAIGSVAAIIAAGSIAARQTRSVARLEANKLAAAEVRKLLVLKALFVRAHSVSGDILRAFETKSHDDFGRVAPDLMLDTQKTLQALPIFDIPDGMLALDAMTIGRYLGELRDLWLAATAQPGDVKSEQVQDLATLAGEIHSVSMDAVNLCKREITRRGYSQDGAHMATDA